MVAQDDQIDKNTKDYHFVAHEICREMMDFFFFFWKKVNLFCHDNFSGLSHLNSNLFSNMSFNQKRKMMYNWHVIPSDIIIKECWD